MNILNEDGTYTLVAQTMQGLEEVLTEEIKAVGGTDIEVMRRAIRFKATPEVMMKANLWCRTAVRISAEIEHFEIDSANDLYDEIYDLPWERLISDQETFLITPIVKSRFFNHTQFAAFKAKDAIVDKIRNYHSERPNIDKVNPDFRIVLKIFEKDCTVLLDSSGDALFKRGYRQGSYIAPINETLAAGLLLLSDWDKVSPILDPFCGSGTLAIEAALIAKNIPPNAIRSKFGFMEWPEYDEDLWKTIKADAAAKEKETNIRIHAYDIANEALEHTVENAKVAGVLDLIETQKKDFFSIDEQPADIKYLIMNPPYDERISITDAEDFYSKIGDQFKTYFTGCSAWLISANMKALKRVGLRPSRKIALFNGPLESKFMNYQMYAGSKKASKQPQSSASNTENH